MMNTLTKAAITGVASYVPPDILSNKDLESMVDTNDEWIVSRTGIKKRHILKEYGKATSDLATEAVLKLLQKTNTDPNDIDLVICGTITADYRFPDAANTICDKAGINNAFAYDINAACSGFLFSLTTGVQYIQSGLKKVIVIGVDKMSSIINYKDRTTCVIFGDGGGAVLLEPSKDNNGFHDFIHKGDGSGRTYLYQKAGGSMFPASEKTILNDQHYVTQDGRPVFKAAVKGMSDTVKKLMERNNLNKEDISWLCPHQANLRIIGSVAEMLDFPLEKVMINIQDYGNTTAGTLPLALASYESKLKKGDKVILTTFGGGFTWGASYLTWAY